MFGRAASRGVVLYAGLAVGLGACSATDSRTPLTPTQVDAPATAAGLRTGAESHAITFTPVAGDGSGTINITATPRPGTFTLNAQVTVNVHGVPPNTVLRLFRSGDIALPGDQQADGVCQRAAAGLFGPVPLSPGGPPAILETSPGGSAALHFELQGNDPFLPDGAAVDVVYRLIDALPPAVPTIDLRTACFTFTAR
jgi:hypothetical protein